jgi:hypothetical protein
MNKGFGRMFSGVWAQSEGDHCLMVTYKTQKNLAVMFVMSGRLSVLVSRAWISGKGDGRGTASDVLC